MSQVPGRIALLAVTLLVSLVGSGGVASAETIQGHVLNPDGTPVTDDAICVAPQIGVVPNQYGNTVSLRDDGGSYTLVVEPGTYNITFSACDYGSTRSDAPTYYGPTGRLADAVTVTVHEDEDVTGIDQKMRPGAVLSGHIYSGPGTGTPLFACVKLAAVDGPGMPSFITQTWTEGDGAYTYKRLDPDFHYKLQARGCPGPNMAIGWYGGGTTYENATPFAVPATGVDIHLPLTMPEDPPADDDPPAEDPGTGTPTGGSGTPTDTGTQKTDTGNGTPPAVVTPPSVTAPAPAVVPVPVVAQSRPAARAAFGTFATQHLGAALRSGLRLPVRCAAACSAKVSISVSAATAKRLKLSRTLTTVRAKLKAGTPTVVIVGLPASVRRAFAHEPRATFAVTVTAAGTTLRHTLSLRR